MELYQAAVISRNRSLKAQAVKKLFERIKARKEIFELKDYKDCKELVLLWEGSKSEDEIIDYLSFEAILNLVKCEKLFCTDVILKMVEIFDFSRNEEKIINVVSQLFALTKNTTFQVATSSLRLSHPFNVMLSKNMDSSVFFIPVITEMFNTYGQHRESFFNLTDPFFKFLFFPTNPSKSLAPLRTSVFHSLIGHGGNFTYLCKLLSWFKLKGNEAELVIYLNFLAADCHSDSANSSELFNLILSLHTECSSSQQEGNMGLLLRIVRQHSQLLENVSLFMCCLTNLFRLSNVASTFEILYLILKRGSSFLNVLFVSMLVLPLLQFIAASDTKAAHLLMLVDDLIIQQSANTVSPSLNKKCNKNFSMDDTFALLANHLLKNNMVEWLKGLSVRLNTTKMTSDVTTSTYHVECLVSGIFITSVDFSTIQACLECMERLCQYDSSLSIDFFPLLMYKLKRISDPEICFLILNFIPALATNEVSASMTLKFLKSGTLTSATVNLLCSLWRHHDSCFPHLIGAVQDCIAPPNELALAQAGCIRNISQFSAFKHGKEVVGLLFKLLEGKESLAVRALCLDGVYYLLLEKVLNLKSFWSYFTTDLKGLTYYKSMSLIEARPVLKIFSLASSHSDEKLVNEIVALLWKFLMNGNQLVINEVFLTLSHFSINIFVLSHLPAEVTSYQEDLMERTKVEEDLRNIIYGCSYVRLLEKFYSETTAPGLEKFFKKLVEHEMLSLPRGCFHKYKEMIKLSFDYQLQYDEINKREADLKSSKLPTNFTHLRPNSTLKSCLEFVQCFIQQGMSKDKLGIIRIMLSSLTNETVSLLLPPFNWNSLFGPLLVCEDDGLIDAETKSVCMKLLFQQSVLFPAFAHSLLKFMKDSKFDEYKPKNLLFLFENFSDVLTICPVTSVKFYFEEFVFVFLKEVFVKKDNRYQYLLSCFFSGLSQSILSQKMSKETKNMLWQNVEVVCGITPIEYHKETSSYMLNVPEVVANRVLQVTDKKESEVKKIFLLRCSLILKANQVISFINPVIERISKLDNHQSDHHFETIVFLQLFESCTTHSLESKKIWMIEFIAYFKFTLTQKFAECKTSSETASFLLLIWFCSIVKWSKYENNKLLCFPSEMSYEAISGAIECVTYNEFKMSLLALVPSSFCCFLNDKQWSNISDKVLEFLYFVHTSDNLNLCPYMKKVIIEILRNLRSTEESKNFSFWMRIADSLNFTSDISTENNLQLSENLVRSNLINL